MRQTLLALAIVCACVSSVHAQTASWYGEPQRTASGERFNPAAMTAAHRTLPFGTRVRVCRKSCVVGRINDRGPAAWTHRDIDLSAAAARAIGLTVIGVGHVTLQVLR